MHVLHLLKTLVLGAFLVPGTRPFEANTCTVMACGNPGLNGLPGRDGRDGAKGEKGDRGVEVRGQQGPPGKAGPPGSPGISGPPGLKGSTGQKGQKGEATAIDTIQTQIAALERTIQTLQEDLKKSRKLLLWQGAVSVGEKAFVSTNQENTFSKAKELCASAGGALATPRSEIENRALAEIMKKSAEYAFVGINDIQTEGQFVYLDGTPVRYTNWKQGEPNNLNNEDCVILLGNTLWNDISCERKTRTFCEVTFI